MGNWLVSTSSQRLPSMQNAFGRLLASQSTGEAILCSIFAAYYSPAVFFDIEPWKKLSKHFGLILLICYDICIFSHLFIALNRMCAICFPMSYDKCFNKSMTKLLIVISWVVPITVGLILYVYHDCDFVYDNNIWAFLFTQTPECKFISWNIDFYKDLSIVIVIAVVDIVTIIKVHLTNVQIRKAGLKGRDRRRKMEINFLKQAVLQGIVFVVELYTYFYLAWQYKNKWATWALTTVAWNIVHCSDSLIIIGFNAEFRKLVSSPFRTLFRIGTTTYKKRNSATADQSTVERRSTSHY
ncbi:hypothetical protein OESDEN_08696 [Oesophagostomum dentatum]|uniref:G-protein coupled receptors family 1 profile domain-containing protein n=1 Tax=Oesophagostomum dentatum TaxID=61180 RepID=A0A0B1T6L0_OESDE|nr:hypothetical protein OESDEN_08696 [Oesophagostomum dentatum]